MRDRRRLIARETVAILERGWYDHPEAGRVTIADDLARSVAATRLWTPDDAAAALGRLTPGAPAAATRVEVTNEASLAAARRLAGPVGCLNFASAKNPGGGFLGGAEAQEESLARSSGLYHCLLGVPGFYSFHRSQRDLLYSDHVIFSPAVPVFRDERDALLARPYPVSFVTAAAPNAGALGRGDREGARGVLGQRAAPSRARRVGLRRVPQSARLGGRGLRRAARAVRGVRLQVRARHLRGPGPGAWSADVPRLRGGPGPRGGAGTWPGPVMTGPDAAGCCHAYPCCPAAPDQRRRS